MSKKNEEKRKVFLGDLPKYPKGKVNWRKSIGYKVDFVYDDIKGEINIIDYNPKGQQLTTSYKDKECKIHTSCFLEGKLGNIIGTKTSSFKYGIGQRLVNNKRDLTITDRKKIKDKGGITRKYYKYKCNKCGFDCGEHYKDNSYKDELWDDESHLINNGGCSCCNNKVVVRGINDVPTTNPEMVKYFQGGYNEACLYSKGSQKKINPICVDCGKIKDKPTRITDIHKRGTIGCTCSDGFSYGHKYIFSLLIQLDKSFIDNYTFEWCKFFNTFKDKEVNGEYDFILEKEKLIIEVDGDFHRRDNKMNGQTKEESIFIDNEKDRLANEHGYKVIRISDEGDIKQNILDEDLNELFDLSQIDWNKCQEFALTNRAKEICKYKKDNPDMTANNIAEIKEIDRSTIIKWLKTGNELGWCIYDAEEEKKKAVINNTIRIKDRSSKQVEIFKNNISLGVFPSATELERKSEKLFEVKLIQSMISDVCLSKRKQYKGYTFKYV